MSLVPEQSGPNWVLERHDEDDGSISWEIWDHDPHNYRRVITFNDDPSNEGRNAKADAEFIVRLARKDHP